MTILICDVCLRQPTGYALIRFSVGDRTFDACEACQDSVFRVPRHAHATVMLSPGSGVEVFAKLMDVRS